jgi:hypothetical protein
VDVSHYVDAPHAFPVSGARRLERPRQGNSCIGTEQVDASKPVHRLRNDASNLVFVADIRPDADSTEVVRDVLHGRVQINRHNSSRALPGESLAQGAADAVRSAGNDYDGVMDEHGACGAPVAGGNWQGWIEFVPVDLEAEPLRSPRETTQPNHADLAYWATGLTPVYLEGALRRALSPTTLIAAPPARPPAFAEPAPRVTPAEAATRTSVLDPFSVYQKGESLLRRQLGALSAWHLVNIVREYELAPPESSAVEHLPAAALIDMIITGVKAELQRTPVRRG